MKHPAISAFLGISGSSNALWVVLATSLLASAALAQALPANNASSSARTVPMTPITQLAIGPTASGFWDKLRRAIDSRDIASFDGLTKQFDLTLTSPAGTAPSDESGSGQIIQFKSNVIKAGRYGLYGAPKGLSYWDFGGSIDLRVVCISGLEIERVYGVAKKKAMFFADYAEDKYLVGYPHALEYEDSVGNFRYGFLIDRSGCASFFSLRRILTY
ncbi:MAG: hypothetical protein EON92_01325 [Burkholderiales bacterium]|nr:MAG: hypothetical protein EON92_01325 [Burkholderiales bacterium]